MKTKVLSFFCGIAVTVLFFSISITILATSAYKNVDIYYKDIKICIDGTYIEPKDANGNKVEPFIMDGTTYLPVRAVANAFGKEVAWDSQTNTAFLGAKPGETKYGRTNPAPIGTAQTITISNILEEYTATVVVKEVIRGDKAWKMIKEANMFNSEPEAGQEYVLVKVSASLSNVKNDVAISLNQYSFDFYRTDYSNYDETSIMIAPEPRFRGEAYDGGTIEGYICQIIDENDSTPSLVFGNDYSGKGGVWFSLTK